VSLEVVKVTGVYSQWRTGEMMKRILIMLFSFYFPVVCLGLTVEQNPQFTQNPNIQNQYVVIYLPPDPRDQAYSQAGYNFGQGMNRGGGCASTY
jgi:hypothetical protein